jgi:hypothetical protein
VADLSSRHRSNSGATDKASFIGPFKYLISLQKLPHRPMGEFFVNQPFKPRLAGSTILP